MPPRVLIVEDEPEIAELIEYHLTREGMVCTKTDSGRTAIELANSAQPDIIVLDRMLPDHDGMDVCRGLKNDPETRRIPIVFVTAKGEDADIVSGLELGAEDYVVKPFSTKVLIARVKNILRRHRDQIDEIDSDRINAAEGRLLIDPARHRVEIDGIEIDLTLTEFGLLRFLAAKPGFVRTRDQIINAVHGQSTVLSNRTVDVHVTSLRRKFGDLGEYIETIRGVGYRFSDRSRVHMSG